MFLIFYSLFRFVLEFYRAPDIQVGYFFFHLTLGQIISIMFFLLGMSLFFIKKKMKIKKNQILTIDKYINEALYNNKFGYYIKNNPFGKNGDYITSPNISIFFSEMIAIWIISFWQNLKCPKKFNLIELGAGNGEMMKQILNTFDKFPSLKLLVKFIFWKKMVI